MKIAFIGHKGYPSLYGGVEKVVEEIVNRLADRGHQCIVYSRKYYTDQEFQHKNIERIIVKGIKTSRLDTLTHTYLSLMDVIRRDVDVVAIHSFGNAVLNFVPRLLRIPVAMHLHGFEWGQKRFNFFERNFLLKLPLLTLKRFSNYITTVSVEQHLELNKRKIQNELLPNGVQFNSNGVDHNSESDEKYFLFVGRIAWQKGIEYLIKAFNIAKIENVKLKIVGDYDHAEKLYEKLILLAQGNESVEFLGYKYGEELNKLYANAYSLVIPSENEECPMVLLEGMSHHKCIIASKIPGVYNIAKDNVIYFESKNYEQLAELLIKVSGDSDLKKEYEKKHEQSNIMQQYDWESIVDRYENIYQEISIPYFKKKVNKIQDSEVQLSISDDPYIKKYVSNDIIQTFTLIHKLYYKLLRPIIPVKQRRVVQKRYMRHKIYKQSFIDDSVVNYVTRNKTNYQESLYPENYKSAILLTHDVDTEEGFKFIPKMIEKTQQYGFNSCWYIIPYKYKIDNGIIKLIREVGDEIGIHGYNHDGKLFSSKRVFDKRAQYINKAINSYNAKGFRAPMVHRNLRWLQELDVEYDASCFDYDPFQPFPGGTGMIWPFIVGKLVELPYTIPQDHTLFYEVGKKVVKIWKQKIDWLVQNNGMVMSITHPDYLIENNHLETFEELLTYLSSVPNAWRCLPTEMSNWWLYKHGGKQGFYIHKNESIRNNQLFANINNH